MLWGDESSRSDCRLFSTDVPSSARSDSPYSEHGALEEVEQDGGTEPHTSEDGRRPLLSSLPVSLAGASGLLVGFLVLLLAVPCGCQTYLPQMRGTLCPCSNLFLSRLSVTRKKLGKWPQVQGILFTFVTCPLMLGTGEKRLFSPKIHTS